MSVKDNKVILSRFWEEVFNRRNLDLIDDLFTQDWSYHGVAGQ